MRLLSPQLQAFLAIVKNKTVHGAAKEIFLTQTAVTQRIRALENKLGASLFIRSRRGMLLTSEGEALLRYCTNVIELEGEAIASITKSGSEQTISMCMTGPTTIMHSRIIPHCINVMKKFPKLLMQFKIVDEETRVKLLTRGESQLAILDTKSISNEMKFKPLLPQRYIMVASSQWKQRKLKQIISTERIIDFEPEDEMTYAYLKSFDLLKHITNERHFVNRTDTLASMIASGLGYGVLPLEYAKPYITSKKLITLNSGKTYGHAVALAWFPRGPHPKYFSSLIDACN